MARKRTHALQTNLEPNVHRLTIEVSEHLGLSASNYIRQLIIVDLRARGAMTDRQIADMSLAIPDDESEPEPEPESESELQAVAV